MGADAFDFVEQGVVCKSGPAQFGPITPATATDHVVYGGERKALVIQVAVLHGFFFLILIARWRDLVKINSGPRGVNLLLRSCVL